MTGVSLEEHTEKEREKEKEKEKEEKLKSLPYPSKKERKKERDWVKKRTIVQIFTQTILFSETFIW